MLRRIRPVTRISGVTLPALALSVALTAGAGVVSAMTMQAGDGAARASSPVSAGHDLNLPVRLPHDVFSAPVAPLHHILEPDVMVLTDHPLTAAQIDRLRHATGAAGGLTTLDVGVLRVAGASTRVVGVDPSQFRAFTPPPTAASDPLWRAVSRGELVASYDLSHARKLSLGSELPIRSGSAQQLRLGGVAALGLPHVGVVVTRAATHQLGLTPHAGVVLAAPGRSTAALQRAIASVLGASAHVTVLRPSSTSASTASYAGKPRTYRELYQAAARTCPGLSWTVLAAIGQVESDHGRNPGPSSAGALGPMQFLPSTWADYGIDGDHDGKADIWNPYDAVYSAAHYLCVDGAGAGGQALYDAIFNYNHADWYVREVLALARQYR